MQMMSSLSHLSENFLLLILPTSNVDDPLNTSRPTAPGRYSGGGVGIKSLILLNYYARISGGRFSAIRPSIVTSMALCGRPDSHPYHLSIFLSLSPSSWVMHYPYDISLLDIPSILRYSPSPVSIPERHMSSKR